MYMWAHLQLAGQVRCRPKVNVPSLKDQQPLLPWTYEMMQNPLTQEISLSLYSGSCCSRLPGWFCTKAEYFIFNKSFFFVSQGAEIFILDPLWWRQRCHRFHLMLPLLHEGSSSSSMCPWALQVQRDVAPWQKSADFRCWELEMALD